MPRPFAQHYDIIYADKNYDRDIEVFEALAQSVPLSDKRVVEIGGGTGNHSQRLARRVGELVSIETDADFAEILRRKLACVDAKNVACFDRPIEDLTVTDFDAAAAFFHVLNYMGHRQLASFADGLARRLKPGACLVADLWNGAAALLDPPRDEVRRKQVGDKTVTQRIRPHLDIPRRSVTLNYEIDIIGPTETHSFTERIDLYLWRIDEVTSILAQSGFPNVMFWDYRQFPEPARPESWRLWLRAIRD